MPKRREPSHDWQQIQPLLKDPAQIQYEILRPVVLWGQTPKERGAETGVSPRTIYYRANLFDQAGMASLLPAAPPPAIPKQDKRTLPPDMRQEIVDLHAQYPALSAQIPPRAGANSLIACWSCNFPCCPTARKVLLQAAFSSPTGATERTTC